MKKLFNVAIRFKGQDHWNEYSNVYFIRTLDEYRVHLQEINNKFSVAENEIKNLDTFVGHGYSALAGLSGLFCGMIDKKSDRMPMLNHLKRLQGTLVVNQVSDILDGKVLVINKKGGYFPIKPSDEYTFKCIESRKYVESDIKTLSWRGGAHYYAKVGNIDVVSRSGDVKWDTHHEAYSEAVKYIEKLNSEECGLQL